LSALAEALHRFERPWIKVGRIYRRICFLRVEGRGEEAERMELTEFAEAAEEARQSSPSEADSLMRTLLAEESERVAEAVAFAEVLVPILAERISLAQSDIAHPAAGPRARASVPRETPGIADFIDEMLAQDRSCPR